MMKRMILVALAAAACAPAARSSADPAEGPGPAASEATAPSGESPARDCFTGRVGVEGAGVDPRVILAVGATRQLPLSGPLTRRVRLLTGATVTACGFGGMGPLPLEVEAFELRQVDGMEAHLGQVRRKGERGELVPWAGGLPVPLGGRPLDVPEGATAWVAGEWQGAAFVVLSYGVLTGW